MKNFNELLQKAFELHKKNYFDDALKIYKKLILIDDNNPQLKLFLGTLYLQIENFHLAKKYLKESLDIDKNNPAILNNLGVVHEKLNEKENALELYLKSINISKNNPETFFRIANLSLGLNNYKMAIENYQRAINLKPNFIAAYMNLGKIFHKKEKFKEAIKYYNIVLSLDDKNLDAYLERGNIHLKLKNYEESIENYEKIIEITPFYKFVLGKLIFAKTMILDWKENDKLVKTIIQSINKNLMVIHPSILLSITDEPALHLKASKIYLNEKLENNSTTQVLNYKQNSKINLGYFSSDFYDHATMRLMMEVFKYHDKSKFNIFAFSCGPEINDNCTEKLKTYLNNFYYIGNMDLDQIHSLCKKNNIHIAIDLKGYTQNNQINIFQKRVAPIQISYLGYPSTTGLNNMDYIVADETIIPKENFKFYSEKVLYLPNCYQPNEKNKIISKKKKTKKDFGLDESKFIFCSFNFDYKITPNIFDVWMDILKETPNSILWVLLSNKISKRNFLEHVKKKDIALNRIVFAERLSESEHLYRIKLADIFLDTFPVNAHTTASEVTRMGVPIITIKGQSFASRVAASILHQFKLDELVMKNKEQYKNKAIELYNQPWELNKIKKKLLDNLENSTLFNSEKLTNNLEKIYLSVVNKK